jgi:hypothetical protein
VPFVGSEGRWLGDVQFVIVLPLMICSATLELSLVVVARATIYLKSSVLSQRKLAHVQLPVCVAAAVQSFWWHEVHSRNFESKVRFCCTRIDSQY